MALTGGASHAASGTGSVAISSPAALRVSFTTIPAFLGADTGTPVEYFGLGRINVGTSLGYMQHVDIVCSPQLVLGLPAGLTVVAWDFAPGVVASIQELVESAPAVRPDPWDRAPTLNALSGQTQLTPAQGSVTSWTYTVPAGRRFFVSHAQVRLKRVVVATANNICSAQLTVGGSVVLRATVYGGAVGAADSSDLSGGPMVLPPGTVLTVAGTNSDTGGDIRLDSLVSGFLFDL